MLLPIIFKTRKKTHHNDSPLGVEASERINDNIAGILASAVLLVFMLGTILLVMISQGSRTPVTIIEPDSRDIRRDTVVSSPTVRYLLFRASHQ